jgi:hypothetical protein
VRDTLTTHQVSTVVLPSRGRCLRMAATPDPEVKDLYKRLQSLRQDHEAYAKLVSGLM